MKTLVQTIRETISEGLSQNTTDDKVIKNLADDIVKYFSIYSKYLIGTIKLNCKIKPGTKNIFNVLQIGIHTEPAFSAGGPMYEFLKILVEQNKLKYGEGPRNESDVSYISIRDKKNREILYISRVWGTIYIDMILGHYRLSKAQYVFIKQLQCNIVNNIQDSDLPLPTDVYKK